MSFQPCHFNPFNPQCLSTPVTDSYVYDSFGNAVLTTGTTKNPFRYVGQIGYYFDIDVVRYWLRARYLSLSQGRFLSRDPIGFAITDVNLYRHASNEPTNATDPSGQQIVESGVAGGCATVVWPTGATIVVVGGGVVVVWLSAFSTRPSRSLCWSRHLQNGSPIGTAQIRLDMYARRKRGTGMSALLVTVAYSSPRAVT
jgi:RHS repeat-associated protein